MIDKLLCLLNIHDWDFSYINGWVVSKRCNRCNKEVIFNTHKDYYKEHHKGF